MNQIQVGGLHHVTALTADAQRNADFYSGVLGLRFVKKTVNQDDPFTYHLYYGDSLGRPGTAMTFFPYADLPAGRPGRRQVYETAFSVPAGALGFWRDRLERHNVGAIDQEEHFGVATLRFVDPDGLIIRLVEDAEQTSEAGWPEGPVPANQAVRAFSGVRLGSAVPEETTRILTDVLGYEERASDQGVTRFAIRDAERAGLVDLLDTPPAGRPGVGTVHHVAFRVPDQESLLTMRQRLVDAGIQPTPEIDRFYFRSVYFREPGGILFEIATDDPGFATDETADELGTHLKLPPQYEPQRAEIEQVLPSVQVQT